MLGYDSWLSTLERGAASHHAGLIPAFKETVEELFLKGLVKVVAATETLAVGINMPARTVILDSLSKFTGEGLTSCSNQVTSPSSREGRAGGGSTRRARQSFCTAPMCRSTARAASPAPVPTHFARRSLPRTTWQ